MAFIKIDGFDLSPYCNSLAIKKDRSYNAQANAAGNTVVDYINTKRTITVGVIVLNDSVMANLQSVIDNFSVSISYRNPKTNQLEENIKCIIPSDNVEYYTIQSGKVMYKALTLTFLEL